MRSMRFGQVAVVCRSNGAAVNLDDIGAAPDPLLAQRRQTALDVAVKICVTPGAARVVNADGFVDFNVAGDGFRRREGNFAERNAEVGVE